jgi:hypothetical protein
VSEVFIPAFVEFVPPVIGPVEESLFLSEPWLPGVFVYLSGMPRTKLPPALYLDLVLTESSPKVIVAVPLEPAKLVRHDPPFFLPF